jgi:hypothetical protein
MFPVTVRDRRKSPNPGRTIGKLFPTDRIQSKTPTAVRSVARENHSPIPKLKLRVLPQTPDIPQTLRDFRHRDKLIDEAASVTTREVLTFKEKQPRSQVNMIRLQVLGDLLQKLTALSKPPSDSLLDLLKTVDSSPHPNSGCSLCGCTCKGLLPTSSDSVKRLSSSREPSKQTILVDISEEGSVKDCLSCGNRFCSGADSSVRVCSLCQEHYVLAKKDKLTLQLKIRLDKCLLAEPSRTDVSQRLLRLRTDRGADFPPRFITPTKAYFPVQYGPSLAKEVQTDPVSVVLQLALAGQKFNVKLNEALQTLHFILPDPAAQFKDKEAVSKPMSEYTGTLGVIDAPKDQRQLTTSQDQSVLKTPKFNRLSEESTTLPDQPHTMVFRQLTERLELVEIEAEKAAERLNQCFNSLSADLAQFTAHTLKRDAERSLETVVKVTAPLFNKLGSVSPSLNDALQMAFGLLLMVTDHLLTTVPGDSRKTEVERSIEETRKKMRELHSGLQQCQENYEERLLQLLKLH